MTFSEGEMCPCGLMRTKKKDGQGWNYDYSETVQRFWIVANSGKQYVGLTAFILILSQYVFRLRIGKVRNFVSRGELTTT
jgi:hypothetical protein